METTAIGSPAGVANEPRRGLAELRSEDFFNILVSELQQQDPFEPTKTADMIGQISQIRGIELSSQLSTTLAQMTQQQRLLGTSELIGKFVTALVADEQGNPTQLGGVVTAVRFMPDGTAILDLDTGQAIPAAAVQSVAHADAAVAEAQPDATGEDAKAEATARGREPLLSIDSSLRL